MEPLTHPIPKPLLPVADRPLVAHVADDAVAAGTDELILTVGDSGDRVRMCFGSQYASVPVRYAKQPRQHDILLAVNGGTLSLSQVGRPTRRRSQPTDLLRASAQSKSVM